MNKINEHLTTGTTNARWQTLVELKRLTDKPMIALSIAWLFLIVIEFLFGIEPHFRAILAVIWVIFVVDFLIEFMIAPDKTEYLKKNWLLLLSLALPPFQLSRGMPALRAIRPIRAVHSINLLRILTSLNRSIHAIQKTFVQRGLSYVLVISVIVTLTGASAMTKLETPGLKDYGDALWWTAMIMTTAGSDYSPKTGEGRIVAWLLSLYAITVFSYLTASLASHFIGIDRKNDPEK